MSSFDFSIIIVNFNSEKFISACLASIYKKLHGFSFEIIIVHNSPYVEEDFSSFPHIKHFPLNENVGFGKANNIGASNAKGDLLFFLNPDTVLKSDNFSPLFSAFIKAKIAIVAPKLTEKNGEVQPWSVGKKVTLFDTVLNNLSIVRSKKIWNANKKQSVEWVSGGAFVIRADVFRKANGFDEDFFMYFEDVDLCARIKKLGFEVIFFPEVEIIHSGGQSFSNFKTQKKYFYSSQDLYFKKHRNFFEKNAIRFLRYIFIN